MDQQGNSVGPQGYGPQQVPGPNGNPGQNSNQPPQDQPPLLQQPDQPSPQSPPESQLQQFDPSVPQEATEELAEVSEGREGFEWLAPEFVAHDKSASWYLKLLAVTLVLSGLFYLFTRDVITAGMVVVAGIFLGIYARRQPRMIPYQIFSSGISIDHRQFTYDQFRSFAVLPEGNMLTFTFIPLKRFSPPAGMCYSESDADSIIQYLSARLPYEHRKPDFIDNLMELIRF